MKKIMETIADNKKIKKSGMNSAPVASCQKRQGQVKREPPGKTMEQIRMEAVARLREIGIFI